MSRKISVGLGLAITIIAMTVTFSVTMVISMRIFDNTVSSVMQKQVLNNKIAEIDRYVRGTYYGEIEDAYLGDRTARGYVDGLRNSNSVYYTAAEYAELQDIEAGRIVGVGIEVIRDANNYFMIARVYPDSPAERAGVTEFGYITEVDGVEVKHFANVRALQTALLGEQGTELQLTCRYGTADMQTFTIQRVNYIAPTVEYEIQDNVAYVRISAFTTQTHGEIDYAIREIERAGAAALVFDVRNNNASQDQTAYNEVCRVIDRIAPQGTIARTEFKNGTTPVLPTSTSDNWVELPMVVLVNANTAGASELFADSLRSLCGAQVVGNTTAGQGMMQSAPQRMTDGSAVVVTIAKILPANSDPYDGVGIVPEVEAPAGEENPNIYRIDVAGDSQIQRAIQVVRNMVRPDPNEQGASAPQPVSQPPAESVADESAPESGAEGEAGGDASGGGEDSSEGDEDESDASSSTSTASSRSGSSSSR